MAVALLKGRLTDKSRSDFYNLDSVCPRTRNERPTNPFLLLISRLFNSGGVASAAAALKFSIARELQNDRRVASLASSPPRFMATFADQRTKERRSEGAKGVLAELAQKGFNGMMAMAAQ